MNLYDRKQRAITDWRHWTPPKGEGQWRAGRSAMELARSWFTAPVPVVPAAIAALLDSHPDSRGATLTDGWPELVTPLPYPGEGRNHDLGAIGTVGSRRLLLAVEGKVDETLGEEIGVYWRKSKRTPRSRAWKRIDSLLSSTFGPGAAASEKPWAALRYQLLTAIAGTAIEARERGCDFAVLCVHEFVTESAKPDLLKKNDQALGAFLRTLGADTYRSGTLAGPFAVVVGEPARSIPVLVGKAQYRWTLR